MSLINKMLQDLDARGGTARPAAGGDVRPVAAERSSRTAIAIGAGIGALIVAAGAGGWYYLHREAAPAAAVLAPAVPAAVVPAPAVPAPAVTSSASPDPTVPAPTVPSPAEPVATAPAPQAVVAEPQVAATPAPAPAEAAAPRQAALPQPAVAATPSVESTPTPQAARPRPPRAPRTERDSTAAAPAIAVPERQAGEGATLTSRQQGENAYRRALAALQEGRVTEGVGALEHAVQVYPRHEAARQTLVGLLLENGQADEAMRHAQLGLGLDSNQPQLAMVLARLQLERGGPADVTLLRSLPHASGNAEYRAFLAGVLQKQGRHREAAEQYEAALALRPRNGVWWMGLGISRQAQDLRPGAREAYGKAKEAGLAPELQAFVERRLGQLE
ncbi:tetratricopeptide repeat protein [Pseudoduganella albidiflava]|uniref:Tetratricopeptide repeat protein n=1 Tax=Pseudoduganella albidiflava TaxID=321983 RepID=A0A411WYZ2_9BURK|nr:tetratricopeptide repeat protein [Pseudoduganella albidiflava]QBI01905.1 tetratricopeptide repeat protein [Pseudoduganella albidiflava]GGY38702.1 hypothetical protein GCM10007387_20900 [Pseudoduganella albidiflava]